MNDKQFKAMLRVNLYNQNTEKIKPYILKWWQVIKEFQNKPINYTEENERMASLGLGYYSYRDGFNWCYELKQLDRQLRMKI